MHQLLITNVVNIVIFILPKSDKSRLNTDYTGGVCAFKNVGVCVFIKDEWILKSENNHCFTTRYLCFKFWHHPNVITRKLEMYIQVIFNVFVLWMARLQHTVNFSWKMTTWHDFLILIKLIERALLSSFILEVKN